MANPIQQGLKHKNPCNFQHLNRPAAMANPIQQGLKQELNPLGSSDRGPQWLIQYNKD